MDISIFLAKAFGLYFVIVGLWLVSKGRHIKVLLDKMMDESGLLLVSGFIALILGILLALSHNVWVTDWRVMITISAWLTLTKGIVLITFPQASVNFHKKWLRCNFAYYSTATLIILTGLFLSYHGFFLKG